MTINLSQRGFPMLKLFAHGGYVGVDEIRQYDQRPFRSMILRKYVAYHPRKGFRITPQGREAWEQFNKTDIARMHAEAPLTVAVVGMGFDPETWGLAPRQPIAHRRAAA